jgi:transcriptional regulator of acetoin/glycerol metabolism
MRPIPVLITTIPSFLREIAVNQMTRNIDVPLYQPVGNECEVFEHAWRNRLPLLIKGPTGCGKTRFVAHMAAQLGGLADKHGNAPDEQQVKHHRGIPTYIVAQQVSHVAQVQRPGDNAQPEQVQRHEYRQAREKQAEMLHVLRLR